MLASNFQNSLRINENGSMRVQGQTPPQAMMMRINPANGKYQPVHYSMGGQQQPQPMGYGPTYSPTHSISGGSSQHSGSPRTSITSQNMLMTGGGGPAGYGLVANHHNGGGGGPGHLYENLDYYGVEGG